jgi:hypothetical protein
MRRREFHDAGFGGEQVGPDRRLFASVDALASERLAPRLRALQPGAL